MAASLGRCHGAPPFEKLAQVGDQLLRLALELSPGDADDEPAGHGQTAVACAVALVAAARGVDRMAVELGHELGVWPSAVRLVDALSDGDVTVDQRERQARPREKGDKEGDDLFRADRGAARP